MKPVYYAQRPLFIFIAGIIAWLFCAAFTYALAANAPGTVTFSGNITPSHLAKWFTPGVIGDAGTSQVPGINTLGILSQNPCPFAINTGQAPAPNNQLCFGVVPGQFARISLTPLSGASPIPLQFDINGVIYNFPFTVGGIVGPSSTTPGDFACWSTNNGQALLDCGTLSNFIPNLPAYETYCNLTNTTTVVASPCHVLELKGNDFGLVQGTTADNSAALVAFFNTCANNNYICAIPGGLNSININENVPVATNNLTIVCSQNNATQWNFGVLGTINFSGNNVVIKNCLFNGAGAGNNGRAALAFAGNNPKIIGNTFTNFNQTDNSFNGIITTGSGNAGEIAGNFFDPSNNIMSIVMEPGPPSTTAMTGWSIHDNSVNAIVAHSGSAATNINSLSITNNKIFSTINFPLQGQGEYCVEAEATGPGGALNNLVISGNSCTLEADNTTGGYSIAGSVGFTVANNIFNSNSHKYLLLGIEVVSNGAGFTEAQNGAVTGNVINAGISGFGGGIDCQGCINVTYSGNTITNCCQGTDSAFLAGLFSGQANDIKQVAFTGNTIMFAPGATGNGILFDCFTVGHFCEQNTIVGNVITSDGTAGSVGIALNNAGATFAGITVGLNEISAPATGINISAGISNICLLGGIDISGSGLVNASGPSVCSDTGINNLTANSFIKDSGTLQVSGASTLGAAVQMPGLVGGTPTKFVCLDASNNLVASSTAC